MIRRGKAADIPAIMKFIDEYWKNGHILSRNEDLFRYEYQDGDQLNLFLSVDKNGNIDAFEGFIAYGKSKRDITLSMWKSNSKQNPVLGIELFNCLSAGADARCISCPGINKKTIGIYKYLGFYTGTMNQWYRLNKKSEYIIAKIEDNEIPQTACEQKAIVQYNTFDILRQKFDFEKYYANNPKPLKEAWYIEKRYFRHPIYQYLVYGIENTTDECDTIVVFRIQEYAEKRVLRLVDVIGKMDNLYHVTTAIDALLREHDAEYVDIYECGLSEEQMMRAGWKIVKDSGNIIPNYFSPFVQENIDIYYCTQDNDTILFKGDGDQDRPN